MRLVSKLVGLSLALVALAGFSASSAFADGTADGVLFGDTFIADVGPCGFEMDYTGTPDGANDGTDITFAGSTFTGVAVGGEPACDTSEIVSMEDIDAAISGAGTSFSAVLDEVSVEVNPPFGANCSYITEDPINATGPALLGPYAGSGDAAGDGGVCATFPAEITVEQVLL